MANSFPTPIKLLCFPFSGGNSYSYRKFEPHAPKGLQLTAFDLPGHGRRMNSPLLTDVHAMSADLFAQIRTQLHQPYALYGHSLGTLLVYLVTLKIREAGLPLPFHLFVSGRGSPSVPMRDGHVHLLPHAEFVAELLSYGGIPPQIAAEKELLDLFVPILRADFRAITEYRYIPALPLLTPITVFIGQDEDITDAEARHWQDITTTPISLCQFPGNHFFIFDHVTEIMRLISAAASAAVHSPLSKM